MVDPKPTEKRPNLRLVVASKAPAAIGESKLGDLGKGSREENHGAR
jgi:hypothetical protein